VASILKETSSVALFAEAGMPGERGFVAEAGDRLLDAILPSPREERDLSGLLRRLFPTAAEVARFDRLPDPLFEEVAEVVFPADDSAAVDRLRAGFADAFRLLACRAQAQGLAEKLRQRSPEGRVVESPFFALGGASEAVLSAWFAGGPVTTAAASWREVCAACRRAMGHVGQRLETDGVSVDIVYGLEVVERCLVRMERMVAIMAAATASERLAAVHHLLATLVRYSHQDRSVVHLFGWNLHLLVRKIVERSSATGEHYIARAPGEYRHIWWAAAGGGVLTAATAAVKLGIHHLPLSDFAIGVLYGLNYAVSFLLLQAFGLILATKQPAMTAAVLATILRERRGEDRREEVVAFAARICHSQLAAALGNVLLVSATGSLLVWGWQLLFAAPFLSVGDASEVYATLSPVNSGTVFYAALTGVILFLGSLAGGWFENFCVYHQLPRVLAEHPVGRRLGRERMARLGDALAGNAAGWGTNVSLGFMLGMTPAFGAFLGLPLDVRHVTLNTGVLSIATASLGRDWFLEGWFLRGLVGIAVMFVLNLGVSFLLALANAARAYQVPWSEVAAMLREILRRFVTSPRDFILPPRQRR
jgi:site-specific recombinase